METINPYSEISGAINKILIGLSKGCFSVMFFNFKNHLVWHLFLLGYNGEH